MTINRKSDISQDEKGICGFTHMIQMLIDHDKLTLNNFNNEYGTSTSFANEWLKIQIEHDNGLMTSEKVATALNQSLIFTGDFGGPYSNITLDELLNVKQWDWNQRAGFALTPEAICDYVGRRYSMQMMIQPFDPYPTIDELWSNETNNLGSGIYGIMKDQGAGLNKDQIQHYVYIDKDGELMTWTKTGSAAKTAIKNNGFTKVAVRLYPK